MEHDGHSQVQGEETVLSCVSWNIHRGRGQDGVVNPARTVDVLAEEVCGPENELLLLQEADEECPPHGGFLDISAIEARTGLRYAHTSEHTRWGPASHGFLGVVCFVHPALELRDVSVLDLPGHCHRGAVILEAAKDGQPFRMVSMHLSLSQPLRIVQMRTLGQHLFRKPDRPTVLCGDMNEWRPWGGFAFSKTALCAAFSGPAPATFPVGRPFLPLDRFLASGGARIDAAEVLDGPGIRVASDHRPLSARVVTDANP
ncbi:MAG: endonuclease/exonuclease/phosphatase family protein [Pseudomonadota bacterium]